MWSLAAGEDQTGEPGQYEQKSIRYTGRNIPSRSFRMLQSMTGGDASGSPGNTSFIPVDWFRNYTVSKKHVTLSHQTFLETAINTSTRYS